MSTWPRRNRWGLIALPVAAVLAVAGNAQRLHDYWWDQDLRTAAVTGDQGEWVRWTDEFSDAAGKGTRTFEVRVALTKPTDAAYQDGTSTDLELPSDLTGLQLDLEFKADPDQLMKGCELALIDDEGNRYEFANDVNGVLQDLWACVPYEHPGPSASMRAGEPRAVTPGEERPARWTTHPVVVVPRDAKITEVRLWWELPDYLAVTLD